MHTVAALHSYNHPSWLIFWGSGSLVESFFVGLMIRGRGCTGDFLARKSKNTLGFHAPQKIETKKRASQANRTTQDNPKIAYF
jgi:hypothetical protein